MAKKKALGRGLDSLIPDMKASGLESESLFYCDIDSIRPNPYQPRLHFAKEELKDLASSIKEKGIIQPLVVRNASKGYELIVGERRWRAARLAGIKQVPVVVKDMDGAELLETALIENIQREDLNPLEKANAYHRLMKEFSLTQKEVSNRVGQDRSTVANFLRLRNLPKPIQADIASSRITMGHARALLGAETVVHQKTAWKRIVSQGLSVRQAESLIKNLKKTKVKTPAGRSKTSEHIYMESLCEELSRHLGTKVRIVQGKQAGKLEIEFYSNADLEQLIRRLKTS
jgi:ParB family chromosome partitioning protein